MSLMLLLDSVPWAGSKRLEQGVEITLMVMALFVLAIVISKLLRLRKTMTSSKEYISEVVGLLRRGKWNEALDLSKTYEEQSHLANVIYAGLLERKQYADELSEDQLPKHMNQAMGRAVTWLQYDYGKHLGMLDAIGRTSPFFGALGGTAFTFAFGIILAVPSVWFATYLRNKTLLLEVEMKNSASELTSYIEARPKGHLS